MKTRKKMILAAALCAMALFAGCTTASAVSLEEAENIALDTAGVAEAIFTERRLDPDDGVYEISFTADGVEYEFEVDAKTGAVRELDRDRENGRPAAAVPTETTPAEPAPTEAARITLDEAKAIAYAHAGVSEADAHDRSGEWDDGIYEIDFEYGGYDYEYHISPTGQILKAEKEPDRDDRPVSAPVETTPAETTPAETTPAEPAPAEAARITADEAWAIAFAHAGVHEADAHDRDCEWDDGRWEISFDAAGVEYEYDIAADGTILHVEKETDR